MRVVPWGLALTCMLAACGGGSVASTGEGGSSNRTTPTDAPIDTPARDAATAIAALINDRTRVDIAAAEEAVDVDGFIDAFLDLGATLRALRPELVTDTYPDVTLRFAFDHLPLLVDVVGDDGSYCVDANDDPTNAVASVGPGPCSTDPARLVNVEALFGGNREDLATHLAGALGYAYVGHVRPLVDAAASRTDMPPAAAVGPLVAEAETLLGPLYGWTFTVTETGAGALVELDAGGVFACGLVTDTGEAAAVGGPCPTDDPGALLVLAEPVESTVAYKYGDDIELDALWDACADGALDSCDTLFDTSPVGSLYEAFGWSCGAAAVTDQYCAERREDRGI